MLLNNSFVGTEERRIRSPLFGLNDPRASGILEKGVLRFMSTVLPISARKTGEFARMLEERGFGNPDMQLLNDNIDTVEELLERLQEGHSDPFMLIQTLPAGWLDQLMASEQERFPGHDLSPARQVLTQYSSDQIARWLAMDLRICVCPEFVLTPDTELPWWKHKPEAWYWDRLVDGDLLIPGPDGDLVVTTECRFGGIIALVDPRLKPKYNNGAQMFAKDRGYLGSLMGRLRREGKVSRYQRGRQTSRFGVRAAEVDEHILSALAAHLGLRLDQVRLETVAEMNCIPQLYPEFDRRNDGETNTWSWLHERHKSAAFRLYGGYSGYGGLRRVDYRHASRWISSLAFRPLGVLGSWTLGS